MNRINMVYGDDWQGMYLNGVLHAQGHSVHMNELGDIINKLGGVNEFVSNEVCFKWLDGMGYLPKFLIDIPRDVIQ